MARMRRVTPMPPPLRSKNLCCKNSSNSLRLVEVAKRAGCKNTLLIDSKKEGNIKDILNETLEHEREAIKMYYALLELVQDQSVYLEEFARSMIGQEELHVLEVEKMLKEHN